MNTSNNSDIEMEILSENEFPAIISVAVSFHIWFNCLESFLYAQNVRFYQHYVSMCICSAAY